MNQIERIASPEEQERQREDELSASIRVAMPAIVTAVDLSRQVVSVRPALMGKLRGYEGQVTESQYPVLTEVPIVFPRAGGLSITYPVKVGDECLVIFADSCIDFWWQNGGIQSTNDTRKHDLSDGIAIFGLSSQPRKLSNVSGSAIEIRTDSRSDWISFTGGKLDINIAGDVTVKASSTEINCPTNKINGSLTVSGTISAGGDISSGSVSLQNHRHNGGATPDK
ncbi:Gp138 family membrane-puncturing spike protein [uncultured Parasutterella sp.]|uniref:Gp138 family membrane-puncturing spike protein n=1 Tax=uncultured Parasutterella sp. TaxID=1263098 RepID=UPI00272D74CB|nr:Gp138 family membrane-puncturing spike protein [uncultured Parasutterella sp.]